MRNFYTIFTISPKSVIISKSLKSSCCSVTQSCLTLWDPVDCSTPGFPVLHHLLELARTHVHWVGDAIQPSYPLSCPFPAFSLSQNQDLFQWESSSHQVAKVLELQLQHQSFQWMNIQDWFPLGLTGLILLSRVFSSTTVQNHQSFSAQPSLWPNCHIQTWLLTKP